MALTNTEFARRVGCNFSTASRYRHGQRTPSYAMLLRIVKAFDVDMLTLTLACAAGPEAFGQRIRQLVFEAEAA